MAFFYIHASRKREQRIHYKRSNCSNSSTQHLLRCTGNAQAKKKHWVRFHSAWQYGGKNSH
eukprot:379913-Pelagomonas_calceolata.AAC.2